MATQFSTHVPMAASAISCAWRKCPLMSMFKNDAMETEVWSVDCGRHQWPLLRRRGYEMIDEIVIAVAEIGSRDQGGGDWHGLHDRHYCSEEKKQCGRRREADLVVRMCGNWRIAKNTILHFLIVSSHLTNIPNSIFHLYHTILRLFNFKNSICSVSFYFYKKLFSDVFFSSLFLGT